MTAYSCHALPMKGHTVTRKFDLSSQPMPTHRRWPLLDLPGIRCIMHCGSVFALIRSVASFVLRHMQIGTCVDRQADMPNPQQLFNDCPSRHHLVFALALRRLDPHSRLHHHPPPPRPHPPRHPHSHPPHHARPYLPL